MTKRITIYITIISLLLISLIAALIVIYISFGRSGRSPLVEGTLTQGTSSPIEETDTLTATSIIPTATFSTATATTAVLASDTPEPQPQETAVPEDTPAAQPDSGRIGKCEMEGSATFLLVFEDSSVGDPPFGAELIRYAQVDFDESRITMLAFPRYLQLSTPDLYNTYGIAQYTLGSIYHAVYQRVATQPDAAKAATSAVGQALFDNFAIVPDHFLTLNRRSMEELIHLTGAVEVENQNAFSSNGKEFPQGIISLDADSIWEYMTYSTGPGDEYSRIQRQDQVILRLFESIRNNIPQEDLANWVQNHQDLIVSDMQPAEIAEALCILYAATASDLALHSLPEETVLVSGAVMSLTDPDAAQKYVQETIAGSE